MVKELEPSIAGCQWMLFDTYLSALEQLINRRGSGGRGQEPTAAASAAASDAENRAAGTMDGEDDLVKGGRQKLERSGRLPFPERRPATIRSHGAPVVASPDIMPLAELIEGAA